MWISCVCLMHLGFEWIKLTALAHPRLECGRLGHVVIAAVRRPASGRSLHQDQQVGGAYTKTNKWEELDNSTWEELIV